jgi:hypothetical protein
MRLENLFFTLFLVSIFPRTFLSAEQTCSCEMNNNDFGSTTPTTEEGAVVNISPSNQMEDGNDIGKLFSVGGLLFTQNNYTVKLSTRDLALVDNATCPTGYRKMSVDDANVIINTVKDDNYSLITDATKMNFPVGEIFFTTEREFPDITDGSNFDAYKYKAFKPVADATSLTLGIHSTAMSGTTKRTKCVLASASSAEGLPLGEDYVQFVQYNLDITKSNTIDYEVEFTGGKKLTGETSLSFAPQTVGCFSVKTKFKMFDGTILTKCDARFVKPFFGSDSTTSLAKDDIVETVYEGVSANRITSLHFAAATAPMAAKEGGGAYILFKEKDTNALKVQEVDDEMAAVKIIDLGESATPLAITSTAELGIIVYGQDATDTNYSWLARYGHDGSKKWKKTIMKNGADPNSVTEQLTFTNTDGGNPYGMKCMHKPHNGELAVGRGRIFLTFAHYNNFKCGESSRDDHTGDTMITVNFEGENFMLGSSWSASHSLTQRALYDGQKFITSALGDAFPQQIKFTVQDGKYHNGYTDTGTNTNNRFANSGSATVIPGEIPGDGTGQACGRLGGLSMFNASGYSKFAQVYSRKPCTSGYSGNTKTNDVDEIGVVFFDRDLQMVSQKKLTTGNDVNVVTSAKYGENIVVLFSRTSRQGRSDGLFAPDNYRTDSTDEKTYIMLASGTGTVITQPIELDKNIINNDNMIVLENGNVVWSFVDMDNKLMTYKLTKPASSKPAANPDFVGSDPITTTDSPSGSGGDNNISVMILKSFVLALFAFMTLF